MPLIHDPAWEAWVDGRRGRLHTNVIVPRAAWCVGTDTTLAAAAESGDREIEVASATGYDLGKHIWVGGVMHRIVELDGTTVGIEPPLRNAAALGATVAGSGAVVMAFATAGEGVLRVTGAANAQVTVNLVEDTNGSAPARNIVAPTASGDPEAGSVLTVDEGSWIGNPSFVYQWTRDGEDIVGATGKTYTTVEDDVGTAVGAKVTGTNAGGSQVAVSSNTVTVVVLWTPAQLFALGAAGAWYDPSDLSTLWQDTAATMPVTTDGQEVARVDDKSGNGFHLIQTDVANRPVLGTSSSGHRCLTFSSPDYMDAVFGTTFAQPNYIALAFNFTSLGVYAAIAFHGITSSARNGLLKPGNDETEWSIYAGGTGQLFETVDTAKHVFTTIFDGASSRARIDGVEQVIGGSPGSEGLTGFRLAANSQNPPTDYGALRFFGGVLCDTSFVSSLDDVEAWLASKSGVTL